LVFGFLGFGGFLVVVGQNYELKLCCRNFVSSLELSSISLVVSKLEFCEEEVLRLGLICFFFLVVVVHEKISIEIAVVLILVEPFTVLLMDGFEVPGFIFNLICNSFLQL
jgi:hypothetical protein